MGSDPILETIVDAVCRARTGELTRDMAAAARLRLADTVGCALAGFHSESGRAAWQVATVAPDQHGLVIGRAARVSLESAAFSNTAMIRCHDYNDSYNEQGSGHPSDLVGTLVAIAGQVRVDGARALAMLAGAYDALCGMWDRARIGRVVWDQPTMVAPVAAALSAALLGLDRQKVAHAVAMAAVSGISVRQTRQGQLSMWKNLATGFAARAGVAAALLAAGGAAGPDQPFTGGHGVARAIFPDGGADRTVSLPIGAIARTNLKFYPCCYHAHTFAELAGEAARSVRPERIGRVVVWTYAKAYQGLAADPEKWRPATPETADHSLPFIVAAGLRDGRVDESSFLPARLTDPASIALMDRVEVVVDEALSDAFPEQVAGRIEIWDKDGQRVFAGSRDFPRGHHRRPASSSEIRAKFLALAASGYRSPVPQDRLEAIYWRFMALEDEPDLGALVAEIPAVG